MIYRWTNGDRLIVVDTKTHEQAEQSFQEILELYYTDTKPEDWVQEVRGL